MPALTINPIDAEDVYLALKAMHQRKVLRDSPLLDLVMCRAAATPDDDARQRQLEQTMTDLICSQLAVRRGDRQMVVPRALTREDEIARFKADFAADDLEREAWATLYRRYVAGERVSQLALDANQSDWRINDRLKRGYAALASELTRVESEVMAREAMSEPADGRGRAATSLGSAPARRIGNLSLPLTRPLGRDQEIGVLAERLAMDGERLVTILGEGGIGKTRLALHAAAEIAGAFEGGAWFVDLAPVERSEDVVPAIAATLGIPEERDRPIVDRLVAALEVTRRLVVLDNFEHVHAAAGEIASVLRRAQAVSFLITSRSALNVDGEVPFALEPLAVPPPATWGSLVLVGQSPAVQLLVRRARAHRRELGLTEDNARALAGICARLDGLPLAVELVAPHLERWSPAGLLQRLDTDLAPLAAARPDLPLRQQTIEAAIDWSVERLSPGDRRLFQLLGVLADGWTVAAAQAVAGDEEVDVEEGLRRLMAVSLVRVSAVTEPARHRMLAPIRGVSRAKLVASGDWDAAAARHAAYELAFVEQVAPRLVEREQPRAMATLDAEHDNIRAALRWASVHPDPTTFVRLCVRLWYYWQTRGRIDEAHRNLELAVARADDLDVTLHVAVLASAGTIASDAGHMSLAEHHFLRALELGEAAGDDVGTMRALDGLGTVAYHRADFAAARTLRTRMVEIARARGDRLALTRGLNNLAIAACGLEQPAMAEEELREARKLARALEIPSLLAYCLNNSATTALAVGNRASARKWLAESLSLQRRLENPDGVATALNNLACIAYDEADPATAEAQMSEATAMFTEIGARANRAFGVTALADIAVERGDLDRAEALTDEATACYAALGLSKDADWGMAASRRSLARVAQRRLQLTTAAKLFCDALEGFATYGDTEAVLECLDGLAAVEAAGEVAVAAEILGATATLRPVRGIPWSPRTQRAHAQTAAVVRTALGDTQWEEAYRRGARLGLAAAVSVGLGVRGSAHRR